MNSSLSLANLALASADELEVCAIRALEIRTQAAMGKSCMAPDSSIPQSRLGMGSTGSARPRSPLSDASWELRPSQSYLTQSDSGELLRQLDIQFAGRWNLMWESHELDHIRLRDTLKECDFSLSKQRDGRVA